MEIILQYPNELLKTKCLHVKDWNDNMYDTIRRMKIAMGEHNALGIAANQIGESLRIMICGEEVMINPVLKSGKYPHISVEGCLSIPGKLYHIVRSDQIEVGFWSEDGCKQWRTLYGQDAAVVQHEIDHLDGITLIDRFAWGNPHA